MSNEWTPEEIEKTRDAVEVALDRSVFSLSKQDGLRLLRLARIGLRVVDPSPEDVERVARALVAAGTAHVPCQPRAWPSVWELFTDDARAALKAIAEDR